MYTHMYTYDMIWYDMIWYDVMRCDTIRYDMIWYSIMVMYICTYEYYICIHTWHSIYIYYYCNCMILSATGYKYMYAYIYIYHTYTWYYIYTKIFIYMYGNILWTTLHNEYKITTNRTIFPSYVRLPEGLRDIMVVCTTGNVYEYILSNIYKMGDNMIPSGNLT